MGKEQELLEAARNGQVNIVEKILNMRMKKSNPLASLRRTPGPNTQDNCGYTVLHYAALNGHKDVVQSILRYDANVNLSDTKGCTCLHLAAWAGHYDIVNLILMQSNIQANINQTNIDGETALHCAAQFGHSSVCTLLIKNGADLLLRNAKNETPLDLACEYGRYEAVEILVRLRPDLVHCCTYTTHSPLHLAAKNGHKQIVKLLINANFDVNCLTENGTALHEAAFYGKKDVVQTLLDYGVNISLVNAQGKNVFDLLGELNTSVSRIIEKIIENYTYGNSQVNKPIDSLNKSNSLQGISPIANYCDDVLIKTSNCFKETKNHLLPINLNSELVTFASDTSQFNERDSLDKFYNSELVMPPKQFAQESDFTSFDKNFGNQSVKKNIKIKNLSLIESSLKNNFSRSQDSVLNDNSINKSNLKATYLTTFCKPDYDIPNISKANQNFAIGSNSSKSIQNLSPENSLNDIYSSLDNEPFYSYPNSSLIETLNQGHSLQSSFLQNNPYTIDQFKKSNIYDQNLLSTSVHDINTLTNHFQPYNDLKSFKSSKNYYKIPQKPPRKYSPFINNQEDGLNHRNSQSHHQLNYIQQNNKKIFTSEINYEDIKPNKLNYPKQEFFCDMNCETNKTQNDLNQKIKRSTSTSSNDNHPLLDLNYSTLKRYSNVVDELKSNKINENRSLDNLKTNNENRSLDNLKTNNENRSKLETVQRIKVNENDFYAQVDKRRKNSFRRNSNLALKSKEFNDIYDQPSKLIKSIKNQSNEFLNKLNLTNLNQVNQLLNSDLTINSLPNEAKSNDLYSQLENESISKKNLKFKPSNSNQTTFIKSKLNREKRSTIAISLDEKSFELINNFESKPPSSIKANNQIIKLFKPVIQNFKKLKNKNNKSTFIEELHFIKNDLQTGRKIIVQEKNITIKKQVLDQNICTTLDKQEEEKNNKNENENNKNENENKTENKNEDENENKNEIKNENESENEIKNENEIKSKSPDKKQNQSFELINLNKLEKLEKKLIDLKIKNNQTKTVPRRAAPPPPPPAHAYSHKLELNENKQHLDECSKKIIKEDIIDNSSGLIVEKIIQKCDKDITVKEQKLLNQVLNLPLNLDWKHDPLVLYKQTCHYLAFYLGSKPIQNINQGVQCSQQCIKKYQKLLNENKLETLNVVILSISYKCVRFVDVNCQKILNEHNIQNIHYACQDMDHFRFFAYITREHNDQINKSSYNCHVFSACNLEIANEILITLSQAFEIAFRLSNSESIDQVRKQFVKSKLSKPSTSIPQPPPRYSSFTLDNSHLNLSKSLSESQFNQLLISASTNNCQASSSLTNRKNLTKLNLSQFSDCALNSLNSNKSLKKNSFIKSARLIHQRSLPEAEFKNKIAIFNASKQRANIHNKPIKPMVPTKPSFK